MLDLLFGWITKPQYLYTFLDSIIAITEIAILVALVLTIFSVYCTIEENRRYKNANTRRKK